MGVYLYHSFIRIVKISAIERGTFTLIRYLLTLILLNRGWNGEIHTTNVAPKTPIHIHIQMLVIFIYVCVSFHSGIKSSKYIFQSIENFNRQSIVTCKQSEDVVDLFSVWKLHLRLILFSWNIKMDWLEEMNFFFWVCNVTKHRRLHLKQIQKKLSGNYCDSEGSSMLRISKQ